MDASNEYQKGYRDGLHCDPPATHESKDYLDGYGRGYEQAQKLTALTEQQENPNEHTRFNSGR